MDDLPVNIELADGSRLESLRVGSFNAVPRGRVLWDLLDGEGTLIAEGLTSATLDALIKVADATGLGTFRATAPLRFVR